MTSDYINLRRKRAEYAASHAATPSDIKLRDDEIEKIDRAIQPACTEAEQASQLLAAYKVELQDVEGAIKQAKDAHTIERAKKRADAIRAEIDTLEKAALMGESSGNTKGTEAELREAVQERMQEQYENADKVNRKKACDGFLHDTTPAASTLRREAGVSKWKNPLDTLYRMTHGITIEKK